MKYVLLTGLYLIWGLVWGCTQPQEPAPSASAETLQAKQESTPTLYPLHIQSHTVQVELACSPASQSQGLMFRKTLTKDHGMLFIFPRAQRLSFWMKNTLIPLDVAYIDEQGTLLEILAMEPETLTPHPSKAPAKYALEMNQGWFQEHGISPGIHIDLPACPATE